MVICSAKGCCNRQKSSSDVNFHRFPLNKPRLLKKWIVALQRENWQPSKNNFLCSNHFSKKCYVFDELEGRRRRTRLKDDAVPDTFCFDKPPLKKGRLVKQHVSENIQIKYQPEMKTSKEKCSKTGEICETNVEAQAKDDDYCRVCASQNIQEMFEIFDEGNSYIAEKISRCLPIIVLPSDTLSLRICLSCMNKLNTSYDLIITALKTEELLKTNSLSSENSQPSIKFQSDSNFKEENIIEEEEKLLEETLNISEKQVVCQIVLEDNGAVKIRRFLKDKCDQRKENYGELLSGESCAEVPSAESLGMLIKTVSTDLFDDSFLPSINIEGPAMCDLCDITFIDMEAFDQHILNSHLVKYKWKCRLCDEGFEESKDLLNHKILNHPHNIKACEKCNLKSSGNNREHFYETFNNRESKNSEHDYTESFSKFEVQDLTCKFCDAVFESKNSFHKHNCISEQELRKFHQIPSKIVCVPEEKLLKDGVPSVRNVGKARNCENQQCESQTKTKNEENSNDFGNINHRETEPVIDNLDSKKPMQCVTCHKVFTNESIYRRHRNIHDPEYWDLYRCKVCKRPFRDRQTLAEHMQLHGGIKSYMCDLCGRTYNRYANMLKHRKLHKPSNQWEHSCNHCQARFEKMNDLMAHIERSHNSKNLESESESNKSSNKKVKWICRFCGKKVSSKLSLQDHERIHTGLKPYICEWCGREFRSKPNLWQHHLTHTGDRKHKCDICGKKFARKSFVSQHMRVHTGEKPYQCNICGQRFTQSGDMRRHWRKHLEVKLNTPYYVGVPTQEKTIFVKVQATH